MLSDTHKFTDVVHELLRGKRMVRFIAVKANQDSDLTHVRAYSSESSS